MDSYYLWTSFTKILFHIGCRGLIIASIYKNNISIVLESKIVQNIQCFLMLGLIEIKNNFHTLICIICHFVYLDLIRQILFQFRITCKFKLNKRFIGASHRNFIIHRTSTIINFCIYVKY